jgi:AbrB family looped-hinge helix DNA binding protein
MVCPFWQARIVRPALNSAKPQNFGIIAYFQLFWYHRNKTCWGDIITTLEIEATVRDKNQITIPRPVAERHNIEPGQRIVIVDTGAGDEFVVRVLRPTYAGALTGIFGTTDENVAYVRDEREAWH